MNEEEIKRKVIADEKYLMENKLFTTLTGVKAKIVYSIPYTKETKEITGILARGMFYKFVIFDGKKYTMISEDNIITVEFDKYRTTKVFSDFNDTFLL